MDQGPKKTDFTHSMIDLTKLYTNYTSNGHWIKYDEDIKAKIIDLATSLHNERTKNKNRPRKSTITSV